MQMTKQQRLEQYLKPCPNKIHSKVWFKKFFAAFQMADKFWLNRSKDTIERKLFSLDLIVKNNDTLLRVIIGRFQFMFSFI